MISRTTLLIGALIVLQACSQDAEREQNAGREQGRHMEEAMPDTILPPDEVTETAEETRMVNPVTGTPEGQTAPAPPPPRPANANEAADRYGDYARSADSVTEENKRQAEEASKYFE